MEEQNATIPEIQEAKRPALLTVACILTIIWSGLWALLSLIGIFASGWLAGMLESYMSGLGALGGAAFLIVFIILFVLFGLSLWGAIKMLGLKKGGFIMYVIPNGLMLLFQIIGIFSAFSFGSFLYLLVSIGFIVLYAMNLKNMK
jgi:tryptophan-rich sensory protein